MIFQLVRFLLVISGTIVGVTLGYGIISQNSEFLDTDNPEIKLAALLGCIGYLLCSMAGRELQLWLESKIDNTNSYDLTWGGFGLVLGLISANLLFIPVYIFIFYTGTAEYKFNNKYFDSLIPLIKLFLPLFFNLLMGYLGMRIVSRYRNAHNRLNLDEPGAQSKLLDTSALIDGRVGELYKLGFLEGQLIVPRFVVNELQFLADSSDSLKRSKGKQGLNNLTKMMKDYPDNVLMIDRDFNDIAEVDAKLIELAKNIRACLITQDFNLKKVAELDQIKVLNLNDLMNALKPIFVSGEDIEVNIIKSGKEPQQGVGFLSDGTMIVVEDGGGHIGKKVMTTVSNILQTAAGRMIFSRISKPK